jgi:CMP-N-acetylneuraminic acid synthetase
MQVLTIIPAKMDSKRLINKNFLKLEGIPMFVHSVNYAKNSQFANVDIIVSSESEIVENYCVENKIDFLKRDSSLCGDVEVVEVYLDVVSKIKKKYDLVVCLQPDNPNRSNTFDECIRYMLDNNYDDLITVNENYKRSGSVRIFKYNYLLKEKVSKRVGCMLDSALDIHNIKDLESVKKQIIKNFINLD